MQIRGAAAPVLLRAKPTARGVRKDATPSVGREREEMERRAAAALLRPSPRGVTSGWVTRSRALVAGPLVGHFCYSVSYAGPARRSVCHRTDERHLRIFESCTSNVWSTRGLTVDPRRMSIISRTAFEISRISARLAKVFRWGMRKVQFLTRF